MAMLNRSFLASFLLATAAVSSVSADDKVWIWPDDYDPRYVQAVTKTSGELTKKDVVDNLTTIGPSDHIRNGSGQILMSMFTNYSSSPGVPAYNRSYSQSPGRNLWVAVAPKYQDFLLEHNVAAADVALRSKQLLGLPENSKNYYVVELWSDNSSLFRPAMDDDITHPKTSLSFVGEMADESNPRRQWFDGNFDTYNPAKTNPPFPWTRAGYTYDWGRDNHVGLSEFIFEGTAGKAFSVRSVISVTSYIYYKRATDSFDVTGWCDTLWVGSNYIPTVAGGANVVDIRRGAEFSGGDGITITDLAGGLDPSDVVINNAGSILASKRTNGVASRQSSVYFTNTGGTVNNSGTISGDAIGILGENSTRSISINNSGTIRGTNYAISTSGGDDAIASSGLLDGRVSTGAGDDVVTILRGRATGTFDGGDGCDVFNFLLPTNTTFTFSKDIENFENVNIENGRVQLNGQVSGATVVARGAALGGNATFLGSLNNYGTVSPGNSIGTINAASYVQHAGGSLVIELAKTSGDVLLGDRLNITGLGTATLADGSTIRVLPDAQSSRVFRDGDSFQFITAGGGVSDEGAEFALDSQFLSAFGMVVEGGYSLTLERTATFESAATEGNNRSMAAALDRDTATAADSYAELINQMLFTDAAAFNGELQRYSPAPYLDASAASNRTTQYLAEALGGYLRTRRVGRFPCTCPQVSAYRSQGSTDLEEVLRCCANERTDVRYNTANAAWANPFGVFYGEETNGDHLGFQSNVVGSQFGIDRQLSENVIFGVGGAYDEMHLTTNNLYSACNADTLRVGPYATWFNEAWYLDASVTGGFHDNDMDRSVNIGEDVYSANGNYDSRDVSVYLGAGRDYRVGASIVTPQASLQYIAYRQDGFEETGAEGADLAVDPLDAYSLRSRVGGQFTRTFQARQTRMLLEAFGGWAHEYLENDVLEARFVGGVSPFWTDRGGIFRDSGYYGLGLTALPSRHLSLFTRYNGEYSTGGHYAAIDAGLTFEF